MTANQTTVAQVDAWRSARSESQVLEFKEAKNNFDFQELLRYCAAIHNEKGGVLLLGISDKLPRFVVGTKAFQNTVKIEKQLLNKLGFRVDVEEGISSLPKYVSP